MKQNLNNITILDPQWIVGFIDGEGCFYVGIYKNNTIKLGYQVTLEFSITQHIRDTALIKKFIEFFKCGYLAPDTLTKYQYRIRDLNHHENYLFPLLDKYPLKSMKENDYEDFKKVHALMKKQIHLTENGLEEIRLIKAGMNKGRKFY